MPIAQPYKFVDSLHQTLVLEKGDYFIRQGYLNQKIGSIEQGVVRGFVYDQDSNEVTTHFYHEGDILSGNFIPNVAATINLQAVEKTTISMANFSEVMSHVNKNKEITDIINRAFEKMNQQLQSRLVALVNLDSIEKYKLFLEEYPNLINRIPHYLVANFLGITPTQLSRARKRFSQQM
ncbi:cAMP-binding domain of CRP or a regulatory subunit of cAMP-dependent protein kinases [Reichenbachiella faecimaris]|uniref:cAMP-binding domain of CRP or a regulatory subunit of cAMP-dependent protein kinases n=1 Tax=Reichenbachiella faecimaris TaxID=692418 RepID=A0A1W2GNT2_REIFA|nr:Crp/Fnr family transcriptional regulator [Reichenbachiella faecimaris]SMD38102.1 cAMP-binding domain of CRP or a regulatory subunit of cAMP-dependent protein kinases [Reichenbachiella faecimaris]